MFEKITDAILDWCPCWLYSIYNNIKPSAIYIKIRFFMQRRIRGFDDSETWALDDTFYQWILPRLKRFKELNSCYPDNKTFESWNEELAINIARLERISDDVYSHESYDDIVEFNKWFCENVNHLWW